MSLFSRSAAPALVPIVYRPDVVIPSGHRCASLYLGMILVLIMILAAVSVMAVHLNSRPSTPSNAAGEGTAVRSAYTMIFRYCDIK